MMLGGMRFAIVEAEAMSRRARNAGKKHAEDRDNLREPTAKMPDHRLRQRNHADGDICGRHQIAHQQEKWHREQRFGVHPIEELGHHRGVADRRERGYDQH